MIYNTNFFESQNVNKVWQKNVGKMIGSLYHFASLIDFGCGCGHYLDGFKEAGVNVMGIEYALDQAKKYIPLNVIDVVRQGDLTEFIDCGKFDCALSIEVAEHLPQDKSDIFVDNLIRASRIIILTAAPIGQRGGKGHINEQPKEYWINKMEKRNFKYSVNDVKMINDGFHKIGFACKYMKLVSRNMMVFRGINE